MPRLKPIITLAAIAAVALPVTARADDLRYPPTCTGICRLVGHMDAAPTDPASGSGSTSNPSHADLVAAERAATHMSATLDRFGLIHVHTIPPTIVSRNSDPQGFQVGDVAIGAGAMAALVLLGTASALTVRRRAHLRHP